MSATVGHNSNTLNIEGIRSDSINNFKEYKAPNFAESIIPTAASTTNYQKNSLLLFDHTVHQKIAETEAPF